MLGAPPRSPHRSLLELWTQLTSGYPKVLGPAGLHARLSVAPAAPIAQTAVAAATAAPTIATAPTPGAPLLEPAGDDGDGTVGGQRKRASAPRTAGKSQKKSKRKNEPTAAQTVAGGGSGGKKRGREETRSSSSAPPTEQAAQRAGHGRVRKAKAK